MSIDHNDIFFVIPKEKEHFNNSLSFKLDNIIDFNTWDLLLYVTWEKHEFETNTILRSFMEEYGLIVQHDLVLKVPFKKLCQNEYAYTSYYPYSMKQANYLFYQGVDRDFLKELYFFSLDEMKEGYAIRQGVKSEFYPSSVEYEKKGYYFFSVSITGLPEFISDEGIRHIKEINFP